MTVTPEAEKLVASCAGEMTAGAYLIVGRALDLARAEGAAAERDRIRRDLIDGDPGRLEAAFREFVDDEEAADCALIVAEALRGDQL